MRTSFISSQSLATAPRTNIMSLQQQLAQATEEVVTGRHADVGATLGATSGRLVSLRNSFDDLGALQAGNALATARLDQTQVVLDGVSETANELLRATLALPGTSQAVSLLRDQATASLVTFQNAMNASDGRSYLFGGINTGEKPLAELEGTPMQSVDAAFAAAFGLPAVDPQSSPLVETIMPDDMKAFLEGAFADLFSEASWKANWSTASDQAQQSRISGSRTVSTSASANEAGLRKLAESYTILSRLAVGELRADTRQVLVEHASTVLNGALSELAGLQSRLGVVQQEITVANDRLSLQLDIVARRVIAQERVDPAEKKVEIDTLSTQIEMSYSLTSKIMNLSILNYR
jgi:flagellar hook-associated protein 3 FlgL